MAFRRFDDSGAPLFDAGSFVRRILRVVVFTSIVIIPLFVSRAGMNYFPLPKHLLLLAESIILAAIVAVAAIFGWLKIHPRLVPARHAVLLIALATVAWTIVGTALSTNRMISMASLMTVAGLALIALVTHAIVPRHTLLPVVLLLVPGIINAAVHLLQHLNIWNPVFPDAEPGKFLNTALLGNPNTVGVYLAPVALAAVVLAMVSRGALRLAFAAAAALLYFVAAVNGTTTSLIALAAASATLVLLVLWRRSGLMAFVAAGTVVLILGIALAGVPAIRQRYASAARVFVEGEGFDRVLSHRLSAWRAAGRMFIDHPVAGVGPGTFHYHYLSYRIGELDRYPHIRGLRIWNFGEAHNDHLEILAESGLPGYILFASALILIASCTFRPVGDSPPPATESFARLYGLPFAVLVFIVAIAQFPLQVAATSTLYVYLAAVLVPWGYQDRVISDMAELRRDSSTKSRTPRAKPKA